MILVTDRLRLRAMESRDIDEFVRHLGDWEVQQWLHRPPFPYRPADGETFLAIVQDDHAGPHPTAFVIADKTHDIAIGAATIEVAGDGWGVLGYWLAREHWGRGLAKEAVAALVDHARRHPKLRALRAVADPDNLRSQRVLLACGLSDCGLVDRGRPSRRGVNMIRRFEMTWTAA